MPEACVEALRSGRARYSNGRGEPGLVDALVKTCCSKAPDITGGNILCFPGTQTTLFAVFVALTLPYATLIDAMRKIVALSEQTVSRSAVPAWPN